MSIDILSCSFCVVFFLLGLEHSRTWSLQQLCPLQPQWLHAPSVVIMRQYLLPNPIVKLPFNLPGSSTIRPIVKLFQFPDPSGNRRSSPEISPSSRCQKSRTRTTATALSSDLHRQPSLKLLTYHLTISSLCALRYTFLIHPSEKCQ